jgi:tRNA(Ile)-lysidine synthase
MELLPLLREFNPAIVEALVRLSRSAAQQATYLDSEVDNIWKEAVSEGHGSVSVIAGVFLKLPSALQAHLIRRAVAQVKGDVNEIEQVHVEQMARLMGGPAGRSLDLPGGIRFSTGYGRATVAAADADLCPLPPLDGEHPLKVPGETMVGGWRVVADVVERSPGEGTSQEPGVADSIQVSGPKALSARLGYGSLQGKLWVRPRSRGDRFQPLGMSGQKKLQDFMVDAKIPRICRDRVPLVVSPSGIAWVAGWRIADWAKVDGLEQEVLELRFLRN